MRVSINMAMSMDGKIATKARGPVKLGSSYDSRRMSEIRSHHDAVINGSSTFKAYPYPLHVKGKDLLDERRTRGQAAQPISVVVSSRLYLPKKTPWELEKDSERWAFCGREASAARIRALEKGGIRVVRTRAIRPTPREILASLEAAGATRILLEGGGEFNASFLELGLVDRIHLTLTPLVIGGKDSPTWCEGAGFSKNKFPRFRLADLHREGDEIYLTYEKTD
jgi:riboflavin-specific deaminase-like protein